MNDQNQQKVLLELDTYFSEISKKIKELKFASMRPPYFPDKLAKWRRRYHERLQKVMADFSEEEKRNYNFIYYQKFDSELQSMFAEKIKNPYYEVIMHENYSVPKSLDVKELKLQKDYNLFAQLDRFAKTLSAFCVEMEILADTIEKSKDNGFFESKLDDTLVYQQMRDFYQGSVKQRFSTRLAQWLKQSFSDLLGKFASLVWGRGIACSNVSLIAYSIMYLRIIGTTTFPVSFFIPQFYVGYLIGGFLGSYCIKQISNQIEANTVRDGIDNVANCFTDITIQLMDYNQKCQKYFQMCLLSKNAEELAQNKEKLREQIQTYINSPQKLQELNEKQKKYRPIKETKLGNGWALWEPVEEIELQELKDITFTFEEEAKSQETRLFADSEGEFELV